MKLFVAMLALVPALAVATPKSVPCGTHEKNILDDAQRLYDQGALSKIELVRQQLAYGKAAQACGTISQNDYCASASKTANELIDSTQAGVDKGYLPAVAVDKVIVEMTATIAPCSL